MAKFIFKRGSTQQGIVLFFRDSTKTQSDGGLTGVVWNSAGLLGNFYRAGDGAPTQITFQNVATGIWASGGLKEIDPVELPGFYWFGLPDLFLDSLGNYSSGVIFGVANMLPCRFEIELIAPDPEDQFWGMGAPQPINTTVANSLGIASTLGGVTRNINIFEKTSWSFNWTVVDSNNNPVDLTGHTVMFYTHDENSNASIEAITCSLSQGGSPGIKNVITAAGDASTTPLSGSWMYKVKDITAGRVYGSGKWTVMVSP